VVLKIGMALLVALAIAFLLLKRGGDISAADARKLVGEGARLIDVRTTEEFAAGHIAGAVNIPVHLLEGRLGELGSKEQPIVVYCRSGNRSGRAKRMLQGAGYTSVHDLGAMSRW
jgi:phage shock protein E